MPITHDVRGDFSAIKLQRGMGHYEAPLKWSRLIIDGFSPQTMRGEHDAYSLLFPMEAIFESFVAKYIEKNLPPDHQLSAQVKSKSLVRYGNRNYFQLRPDLCLTTRAGSTVVMDTKWKLIDSRKSNGSDKFGISQADFYQMLAYGYKYLDSEGYLALIYPKTDTFSEALDKTFYFDNKQKLKLRVLPFDISKDCTNRIELDTLLTASAPFVQTS